MWARFSLEGIARKMTIESNQWCLEGIARKVTLELNQWCLVVHAAGVHVLLEVRALHGVACM